MTFDLSDKTILVTGASSGIGRQVAVDASKCGATVVLCARNENELKASQSLCLGDDHSILATDLTKENAIDQLTDEIQEIDGIVHCAGIVKPLPIKFVSDDAVNEVFDINTKGAMLLTSRLLKRNKVKANASLVFISSISSQFPYVGGAIYTASKAAIEAYSRGVALEYGLKGIRSNCLLPAMVKTPMYDQFDDESMREHEKKYLLGVGEPEDVSNAALFLLSPLSKWITGISIPMDGGLTLNK